MGEALRFRICRCQGDCGCITEDAATASAARMLRERFVTQKCDHEAVSCCLRCNVMYLVHVAERLGEGVFRYVTPSSPSPGSAPNREDER